MGKISINEALGKVILRLRREKGMSQEEFAWSIGSSQKYLSDVENGKRDVSLLFASKVADGFGISLVGLFDFIEEER